MRKSTTLIQLQTLHVITQPLRFETYPWRNRRPHDHGFAFQAKGHGKNYPCNAGAKLNLSKIIYTPGFPVQVGCPRMKHRQTIDRQKILCLLWDFAHAQLLRGINLSHGAPKCIFSAGHRQTWKKTFFCEL